MVLKECCKWFFTLGIDNWLSAIFTDFKVQLPQAYQSEEKMTQDISLEEFSTKIEIFLSAVKLIKIIGEAVKNIPDKVRVNYPNFPWKNIAGMRDKLVHEILGN